MKSNLLLLRTLLLSTSSRNIYKHTTDKKVKKRIRLGYFGMFCLYAMIIGYSISMCVGYGAYGLLDAIPVMCATVISFLAFLFTFLRTNGYLFNFREYDMLMSLPFEVRTVAGCKFMYMYVKNLPWYLSVSISMLAGYAIFVHPSVFTALLWILLSFLLPIIPMLGAALLGFLIARISTGFQKTNLIQVILSFVIIILSFSLRYIIEALFRDDKVEQTLQSMSEATEKAGRIYLPIRWFQNAIVHTGISDICLLTGLSLMLFVVVFFIVGRSYRNINSSLKNHAASKAYKMSGQKKHSQVQAIAFKEFKRMTGSTVYITNITVGELLATLLGIVVLIVGFDKIVATITNGAPLDAAMLRPAIPFIVYFCIGMMSSCACSPSLEGKNYWIVQSLPIRKKTLYQGKMLFNMYLTVPFMAISTICICIGAKASALELLLDLILGLLLCAFSTAWGCVCGIRHMRLDWTNEVEVIKQGAATAIYMLPNMFVVMGLVVLMVFLGTKMNHTLLTLIFIVITFVLAALSYLRVMALAKKEE
ncbi:MAG: hypothetical protein K6E18_00930 [Lachnospiraceae bacterium]|nr:hypothetical protein [Lachnospiraceae bacterium]